jgi:hypothetical protein
MGLHEPLRPLTVPLARPSAIDDAFGADELGWIVGEAATLTFTAPSAPDGHARVPGLALLVRHPRLLAAAEAALAGPVRVTGSVYRRDWSGDDAIAAGPDEAVVGVLFGGRGGVALAPRVGFAQNIDAHCGRIVALAAGDALMPVSGASAGPVFLVRYAPAGLEDSVKPCAEDALWPGAWCCAG